ncbi:MAG: pyruvate kinase [Thermodesulfobacteriota bacterium]|nr:pyruvate kinase [Thermodesulfobacteriota bacterium]
MHTRKTKIIATIGPSSNTRPVLKKLISSGMNVARLNFSHGDYPEHERVAKTIRSLSKDMDRSVGIMLDLQGPKMRVGSLKEGGPVLLKKNGIVSITSRKRSGTSEIISTTYKHLTGDVKIGDKILLDDGLIELKVLSKTKDTVTCRIINGGLLRQNKGINLPGVDVSSPSLTTKDKKDLLFGIELGVDFFALSFVRSAKDIKIIKNILKKQGADIPVIAKIEKPEAIQHLDEIIKETDAIMVARGDLGVELRPEQVPKIQKAIIYKANKANKPVITATQMLETMTDKPIPTRAEASDVANAIYDGTDAIMLSGETAVGKYPVKAVQMMTRIAIESEASSFMRYNTSFENNHDDDIMTSAVAQSCVKIAHRVGAKAIVTFSISGKTSRIISQQRPPRPVYAFSPSQRIYNRLSLVWGITPFLIPAINDTKEIIEAGERIIVENKAVKKDDVIVIVTGLALKKGSTNLIKIHRVGRDD